MRLIAAAGLLAACGDSGLMFDVKVAQLIDLGAVDPIPNVRLADIDICREDSRMAQMMFMAWRNKPPKIDVGDTAGSASDFSTDVFVTWDPGPFSRDAARGTITVHEYEPGVSISGHIDIDIDDVPVNGERIDDYRIETDFTAKPCP